MTSLKKTMRKSCDDPTLGGWLRPRGPIQLMVSTRQDAGVTVVAVSGELDVLTATRLTTQLDQIVRRHEDDVVIDLSETEFIDSLGLHALLNVQRRLMRRSRELSVICPNGPVRRAIELARLNETLGVVASFAQYELRRANRPR